MFIWLPAAIKNNLARKLGITGIRNFEFFHTSDLTIQHNKKCQAFFLQKIYNAIFT